MDLTLFAKAKDLEERILQLEITKKYMHGVFNRGPFNIKLETNILGKNTVFNIISRDETRMNEMAHKDDATWITEQIENRIQQLKDQFKEL